MALSKERRYSYRRNLPHIQNGCAPMFISMSTHQRWSLPSAARTIVMDHILRENETRLNLFAAVVMPDHVHLLFSACEDEHLQPHGLAEIMSGIRGPSAHRVNKLLTRRGPVWQEEFFDHVPRFGEFDKAVDYIRENPVKAGLVKNADDYLWLWLHPEL
jgi:REP element-mobilizing transposase RayT